MPPRYRIQVLLLSLLLLCLPLPGADSLRLISTDGMEIDVFGALEARPEGLVIKMQSDSPLITVAWDKLDMAHLKLAYPEAYNGYLDAKEFNRPILLRLGGFSGILSYDEAIRKLYQDMERQRFYTLPENVDYLLESDPDVIKMKARDWGRYTRAVRDFRRELQDFLREIYPRESIIIDDEGGLHRKERTDLAELDKGETSMGVIISYLSDTRHTVSRVGLLYLREVSTFPEDFRASLDSVNASIPNSTFKYGNVNHMKLPGLLRDAQVSVDHLMEAKSVYRGEQYKLGEFYNFIYGQAEETGASYSRNNATRLNASQFPRLDFENDL